MKFFKNLGQSTKTKEEKQKTIKMKKVIHDNIFPETEQLLYCIGNKRVSKKDLMVVKMILDFREALYNKQKNDDPNF